MSQAVWSQLGADHISKQHCEEHWTCGQLESVFAIVFVFVYLCISCLHIRVVIGLRELLSTPRSAANWSPNRTGSDRAGRSLAVPVQNIGIAVSYIILWYIIFYHIHIIQYSIYSIWIIWVGYTRYKTFHQDLLFSSIFKIKIFCMRCSPLLILSIWSDTAVRALVWNNGTLLCKIDFNRNLSF